VPRSGAPSRRVGEGERVHVRVDDGDEYERKVREAIEENLRSLDDEGDARAATPEPDMDFSLEDAALVPAAQPPRAMANKLAAARKLLRQGQHGAARARLRDLSESNAPVRVRVEALTLIAESYGAQGDVPRAAQAYRRADDLSPNDAAGDNARFALARLLERRAGDEQGAVRAYRRYLERAPRGALAAQARQALCRLGAPEHCGQ
jgi:tetratricopeptide (TPR) repeat protein